MTTDKEIINYSQGLSRFQGNDALYKKMLALFPKTGNIALLEEALEQGNLSLAAEQAHAIKGVAGNLSLDALYEAAGLLCEQLRNNELVDETVNQYRQSLQEALSAIAKIL